MNLFILDENPRLAAAGLDDKRIGKALMECTQMMSVAVEKHGDPNDLQYGPEMLCRPTHQTNPVTLWVGETYENFMWTLNYADALRSEYTLRFGSQHASGYRLPYLGGYRDCLPAGGLLPFVNQAKNRSLGLDFSYLIVPLSYRQYLMSRWVTDKRRPEYTVRGWPEWAAGWKL
jgi:hypothetical protein